jgi:hypothetical protein
MALFARLTLFIVWGLPSSVLILHYIQHAIRALH